MQCPLCGQNYSTFERKLFGYACDKEPQAIWQSHLLNVHGWRYWDACELYDNALGFQNPASLDWQAMIDHPRFLEGVAQVDAMRLLQKVRS